MGNLHAVEAADMVADGTVTLEQALSYHLTSNHYPPVPTSMIPVCIEAIEAFEQGVFYKMLDLPEGVSYRGENQAPASAIVEAHHLEAFITDPEEE